MKRIALLISDNLASDAPDRRKDAPEFERELHILQSSGAPLGLDIEPVRWTDPFAGLEHYDAVLVLAVWDYQDNPQGFLALVDDLSALGVKVFNPPDLIRWNIRKTYLRELADKGAPVVPTLWPDAPTASDIAAAFDALGADELVLKRQVGAGSRAQQRFTRGQAIPDGPLLDRPGMIQPFIPSIATEGEYSFLFIDGAFSHAVVKTPAAGDYRIQASFGGVSKGVTPSPADLDQARAVLAALDAPPLYARVDMVRGPDGKLMLMELELIEPFLYPVEDAPLGDLLAKALLKRLG
jgi:glutathione synthase/RimK-type ligase-like ATP-grasp enzyme